MTVISEIHLMELWFCNEVFVLQLSLLWQFCTFVIVEFFLIDLRLVLYVFWQQQTFLAAYLRHFSRLKPKPDHTAVKNRFSTIILGLIMQSFIFCIFQIPIYRSFVNKELKSVRFTFIEMKIENSYSYFLIVKVLADFFLQKTNLTRPLF